MSFSGIIDYFKDIRFSYRKRLLEGSWYFSDAEYYQNTKRIQRNTTVDKRKWNLVLSPHSYIMYGDAPLTVASLVTLEGSYALHRDGTMTFFEESEGGEMLEKRARISKLNDRELVYYYERDQFDNLVYHNRTHQTASADRVYYTFFRL